MNIFKQLYLWNFDSYEKNNGTIRKTVELESLLKKKTIVLNQRQWKFDLL